MPMALNYYYFNNKKSNAAINTASKEINARKPYRFYPINKAESLPKIEMLFEKDLSNKLHTIIISL